MIRPTTCTLLFVSLLTVCSPGWAQESQTELLNEQGLSAFAEGHYVEAAEIFGRAYSLDPRPELLKNRAMAWYRAERCADAIDAAHQFLEHQEAAAPDKQEARALLGACKVNLAREATSAGDLDLAEKLLAEAEDAEPSAALSDRIATVKVSIAQQRAREQTAAKDDPHAAKNQSRANNDASMRDPNRQDKLAPLPTGAVEPEPRLTGWWVTAAGVALLAGTGTYHALIHTSVEPEFRDVAARGTDRERYKTLDSRLRLANWLVPTLYGAGLLTMGSGLWLAIEHETSHSADTSVTVGYRGRF